jgi:hypothetical protein
MTDADRQPFAQAFARLKVALREPEADIVELKVYFTALKDLEIEFIVAAADGLMAHARWFPKTSEWRAAAVKVEAERIDAQRALLRRLPSPLCVVCGDTGWRHDADGRVRRCDCLKLRPLELLGRRPWPIVPGLRDRNDDAIGPGEAVSLQRAIERRTGVQIAPRVMPPTSSTHDDGHHDSEASNG